MVVAGLGRGESVENIERKKLILTTTIIKYK